MSLKKKRQHHIDSGLSWELNNHLGGKFWKTWQQEVYRKLRVRLVLDWYLFEELEDTNLKENQRQYNIGSWVI